MADGDSTIKRGRKFDQVLAGAQQIFLKDGFDGASVDDIAKAAGVSKATLYSYFPDKRLLFMEVARRECEAQADAAEALVDTSLPLRDILMLAGRSIVGAMSRQFNIRMYRMCVAESERFPQVGELFYEFGPALVRERIGFFLRMFTENGQLKIEDFDLASDQFLQLCRVDLMDRSLFKLETDFSATDVDYVVNNAVEMFLARYAA
ncbi:TetR family transcriptional regulator [Marivivens niveibacter]|uniref:TetR family transcriptional regulator n=1 Tax=Marivivens niveibacter TaxID=1930667 RepID=A0A251X0Y1_9RHOB|nr:TetR/AcrR family transcriptional regulator [Marivivens niveibacter]OUD09823.1 TetR family transcriptional regulator [Marivivens niveibacter]